MSCVTLTGPISHNFFDTTFWSKNPATCPQRPKSHKAHPKDTFKPQKSRIVDHSKHMVFTMWATSSSLGVNQEHHFLLDAFQVPTSCSLFRSFERIWWPKGSQTGVHVFRKPQNLDRISKKCPEWPRVAKITPKHTQMDARDSQTRPNGTQLAPKRTKKTKNVKRTKRAKKNKIV